MDCCDCSLCAALNVFGQEMSTCSIGRNLTEEEESSSQYASAVTTGQFLDRLHPATCDGRLSSLTYCFRASSLLQDAGNTTTTTTTVVTKRLIVRMWREENDTVLQLLSEVQLQLQIPLVAEIAAGDRDSPSLTCAEHILEPSDRIQVKAGDILGVLLPSSPDLDFLQVITNSSNSNSSSNSSNGSNSNSSNSTASAPATLRAVVAGLDEVVGGSDNNMAEPTLLELRSDLTFQSGLLMNLHAEYTPDEDTALPINSMTTTPTRAVPAVVPTTPSALNIRPATPTTPTTTTSSSTISGVSPPSFSNPLATWPQSQHHPPPNTAGTITPSVAEPSLYLPTPQSNCFIG